MKYVALLRGMNVGTTKRIDMKHLKTLFEGLGFVNVSTYINSGNVCFESNDSDERTDVAYLFDEVDSIDIIDKLPFKRDFVYVRYVKGALIWNVARENYNKSQLNKLIGHKLYSYMTVRNVNTARRLAE